MAPAGCEETQGTSGQEIGDCKVEWGYVVAVEDSNTDTAKIFYSAKMTSHELRWTYQFTIELPYVWLMHYGRFIQVSGTKYIMMNLFSDIIQISTSGKATV